MCCIVQCSTKKNSKCSDNKCDHQPFPTKGPLAKKSQKNLLLTELRRIADPNDVYLYVIETIRYKDQKFLQYGTGPNFQGDLVTLCTCKHLMRSSMSDCEWEGKWIAGFTGITEYQSTNFLVYLMKVSEAFKSHYDLWFSDSISCETKLAKAAHLNMFGDIYKPKHGDIKPNKANDYEKPCEKNKRNRDWRKDIKYEKGYSGRLAALLVGCVTKSFLWDRPKIQYPDQLPRSCKKLKFNEFVRSLK